MGILAPLFLAGLAALSLPLLLHLVRRTPRGSQQFSSLMFLMPTPPRLTRRSRIDQILLLLLRLGALALLVLAFARPFLRETALLSLGDLPRRQVAILVDASASMQRADLWQQAVRQVEQELSDLAPQDDVALFTFSDQLQAVVGFSNNEASSEVAAAQQDVIRNRMRSLTPTWATSDLGSAMATLAGELDARSDVGQLAAQLQIVVISDFQKGSSIEALQAYEWPARVAVAIRNVAPQKATNAYAQLLPIEGEAPEADARVRVVNAADSSGDQFFLRWSSEDAKESDMKETAVYVPPGQSRVVRLPRSESQLSADRIVLSGDDHDFDNTHYVIPPQKTQMTLVYAGSDGPTDSQGLLYYLRLAVGGDPLREVDVKVMEQNLSLAADAAQPQLVVVSRQLSAAEVAALQQYVERDGTVVIVPKDGPAAEAIPQFFAGAKLREPAESGSTIDYFLLGSIDFTHPLFSPFASPQYNDFTKIHFWQHRPISLQPAESTQVVAQFDNGDPFIIERRINRGRIICFTSGWHPEDSQLAVSSKFVPLIASVLDQSGGKQQSVAGAVVHERITLPESQGAATVIQTPSGENLKLEAGATEFLQTDLPGIYHAKADGKDLRFAVNLAAAESDTAPMDLQQLEQLGIETAPVLSRAEQLSRMRQERDTELEGRQKVWRWLLVACLGLLIFETWWAGRVVRHIDRPVEAVT